MPTPFTNESEVEFIARCMGDREARQTFPDRKQRYAFCVTQWENRNKEQDSKMEYKEFNFSLAGTEVKKIDDEEYFSFKGYASTFGNIDLGDDRIERGAFIESLKVRKPKILWQHNRQEPIGVVKEIYEDDKGLYLEALLPKTDQLVQGRVIPQMKAGSLSSMSIGFALKKWRYEEDIRVIEQADLWEVSVVTFPMNPKATINDFKGAVPYKDFSLADREREWDSTAAIKRIREKTNSTEKPSASYKSAFLYFDSENSDNFGGYKLPIADVIDGTIKAIPRAIFAAAAALKGARGGVDIPQADKANIERNINRYYAKMRREFDDENIVSPFEKSIENISDIKELRDFLKGKGLTQKEFDGLFRKMKELLARDEQVKSLNDEIKNLAASVKNLTATIVPVKENK